jgi:hypothetical protein
MGSECDPERAIKDLKKLTSHVYDMAGLWMAIMTGVILLRGNLSGACWIAGCGKNWLCTPKNAIYRPEIGALAMNSCTWAKLNHKSNLISSIYQFAYRPAFPQLHSS